MNVQGLSVNVEVLRVSVQGLKPNGRGQRSEGQDFRENDGPRTAQNLVSDLVMSQFVRKWGEFSVNDVRLVAAVVERHDECLPVSSYHERKTVQSCEDIPTSYNEVDRRPYASDLDKS